MMTTVVVAGLKRREDRRRALQHDFHTLGIKDVIFAADLGISVDWRELAQKYGSIVAERAFPWRIPESVNPWWNRDLRLGEIACTLTHLNIWSYAHDHCMQQVIVLEDDADVMRGFNEREEVLKQLYSIDPDWDFLYLGRERLGKDESTYGSFTRPCFSYCTYGYAVSYRGMAKLLETGLADCIIPVDEFLPAMFLEHPRRDVFVRYPPRLSAYGLVDDIVFAKPQDDWGSDTEDSPFIEE